MKLKIWVAGTTAVIYIRNKRKPQEHINPKIPKTTLLTPMRIIEQCTLHNTALRTVYFPSQWIIILLP